MFSLKSKPFGVVQTISLELRRFKSHYKNNIQLLTEYFGLSQVKANGYIEHQRLIRTPTESIVGVLEFYERIGYPKSSILSNPTLMRLSLATIDQYYTVMKEGGFTKITPKRLSKFRTLYRMNVSTLKRLGYIDKHTNVAQRFIQHLNPCPGQFDVHIESDSTKWSDIHYKILSKYLQWRLDCTKAEVEHMIEVHCSIKQKSFTYICENIKMAEDLGFSPGKILRNAYVLRNYPKYWREVLEKYPVLVGVSMRHSMKIYPKLTSTTVSNIETIHKILKKHKISDEAIANRMNVFYMCPETVSSRLRELERVEDFKVLLHHPDILKLVVHHNRAKSRLSLLKQLGLKCAGTKILGSDVNEFDIHIKEGKDVNKWNDVRALYRDLFKDTDWKWEDDLKLHPYFLYVPVLEMTNSYNYLKKEEFSNLSIAQVPYVLLYSREKLQSTMVEVEQYERDIERELDDTTKLNLLIYFIEREHHFTGNGIWRKTESVQEKDAV